MRFRQDEAYTSLLRACGRMQVRKRVFLRDFIY
eukprot:COSAG06_NODE_3319_length_5510_cov_27.853631_1_plen_33_part_00